MTLAHGRLDPPLVGWWRLIIVFILTVAADQLRTSRNCVADALSFLVIRYTNTVIGHKCGGDSVYEFLARDICVLHCSAAVVCRVDGDIGNVHSSSDTGVVDILRKHVATTSLRTSIVSHFEILNGWNREMICFFGI